MTVPAARNWRWVGYLCASLIGAFVVSTTGGALRDFDVYWHIRLGNELLNGVSIYDAGSNWSYAPDQLPWVSTQWIVEILFAFLNNVAGFDGLIAFRTVTTAAALITIGWTCLRTNRVWAGLVAFIPAAFTMFVFAQERPQQISFILLPFAGWWWLQATRSGRLPRWWTILVLSALWANCHGLWILLPTALALAAIGRWLDHGWSDLVARQLWLLVIISAIGGSLTPLGPANLLVPLRFASAARSIVEWAPTSFVSVVSLGISAIVVLFAITWVLGRRRAPKSELLLVIVLALFAASAARNIAPAVLILAPVLAVRLSIGFRGPAPLEVPGSLQRLGRPLTVLMLTFGLISGVFTVLGSTAIDPATKPVALISKIARLTTPSQVLNGYNASGLVLWFARPQVSASFVQVGIDGRTDRYGSAYIDRYLSMERGQPGWDTMVEQLAPTVALLPDTDALVPLLVSRGWTETGREAGYVLLLPPGDGQ